MSSVNPNRNHTYPNMDLTGSKNDQQDVKSSGKTNEVSASFDFKKISMLKKNTSKYTPLSLPLDLPALRASSNVSLAKRIMGGAPPSYEETIKKDAETELGVAIKTVPVSSKQEDNLQKPVTDEMLRFIAEQFSIPTNDIMYEALSENMEGFDKLDKQTQKQLVKKATEEYIELRS